MSQIMMDKVLERFDGLSTTKVIEHFMWQDNQLVAEYNAKTHIGCHSTHQMLSTRVTHMALCIQVLARRLEKLEAKCPS